MKVQDLDPSDERLRRTLHEWQVNTELPPRFQDEVWRRIENRRAQLPSWLVFFRRLGLAVTQPPVAVSYVAILLIAGMLAGYWQARAASAHAEEMLSARYVQLVDPYQNPNR